MAKKKNQNKSANTNIYNKKGPNFIYIISFAILVGMIVSAIIVINNVNQEYKIRQVAGAFQKYKYAYLSFNNVYSGIPGDLERATFYWKDKTEDGNGDRRISFDNKESILAWQHLQLAKLIDDTATYSGKWQDEKEGVLIEAFNIPKGLYEKTGYIFNFDEKLQKNIIMFLGTTDERGIPESASLTASEAYNLDLIIDDGMPETGNIRASSTSNGECFVAGEYKLSDDVKECISIFDI